MPLRQRKLLHDLRADLVVRRFAVAVAVSALLSSQLLFQESVLTQFSPAETLDSLWAYFLDIFTMALILAAGVTLVDLRLPAHCRARSVALAAAVMVAIFGGGAIRLAIHFGFGPYPPTMSILGEATRWLAIGASIVVIHESARRRQHRVRQLHAHSLRRQILNNQMTEARIKMMEAQIEPHFLFNTLATVKRLYRTEPAGGQRMMARLKSYLSAALPQIRNGAPTLASELELVRAYLEIMQIRMGTRLDFSIESPPEAGNSRFPCMVLLTLVENAIQHGLNPKAEGGRVDVRVTHESDALVVKVIDDGIGISAAPGTAGKGIGLANIRARLAVLYGNDASLMLLQNPAGGATACVRTARDEIPLGTRLAGMAV